MLAKSILSHNIHVALSMNSHGTTITVSSNNLCCFNLILATFLVLVQDFLTLLYRIKLHACFNV